MRILVTGGAGFIGSNLIRFLLEEGKGTVGEGEEVEVVNLDLLTYAGNPENLADLESEPRYAFVHGDICDPEPVRAAIEGADVVVHLAAESHVDRSIEDGFPFVRTNVLGTQTLLAAALEEGVRRFVHVSTDEVYGTLPWRDPTEPTTEPAAFFTEETPLQPRSPYSASKAASDHLALAYHHTHGLPVVVTRSSNNYGPYQFPEKLIPLAVTNLLEGGTVPVYGDGLNVRDWIHVRDHCRGLAAAIHRGEPGEVYNFGGRAERTNLQVVHALLELLGKGDDAMEFVPDRLGHDRRYAIDPSKAERELGWRPETPFEEGLASTVEWYRSNEGWWRRLRG